MKKQKPTFLQNLIVNYWRIIEPHRYEAFKQNLKHKNTVQESINLASI